MPMILDKREISPLLDLAPHAALCAAPPQGRWAEGGQGVVRVPTARFGPLDVEEDLILTLPGGLIGFETCKRYVVVRCDENSAFRWLQSLEEPAVAFPVADPREFRPDYAPTVADADARALGLTPDTPALLFAVITVPAHNPRGLTANLLGPVVVNALTRQGKQVIVQDEGFTTRHEVVKELARAALLARAA